MHFKLVQLKSGLETTNQYHIPGVAAAVAGAVREYIYNRSHGVSLLNRSGIIK
jgi:hypothetical protein